MPWMQRLGVSPRQTCARGHPATLGRRGRWQRGVLGPFMEMKLRKVSLTSPTRRSTRFRTSQHESRASLALYSNIDTANSEQPRRKMASTTFILGAASSSTAPAPLPAAPALNLLPFSLGSASKPYMTTSAPLSSYFQPRPAPPNTPGVIAGTPIAAFRGRALVGQTIEVPRGYRGVVLSTTARPDHGGVEDRRAPSITDHRALTPASTAASAIGEAESDGKRVTRGSAATTKGAGQVALSRPKRQAPRRVNAKKRVRLDSDDEDEDQTGAVDGIKVEKREPASTPKKGGGAGLGRTPSKRSRGGDVPVITIQQPTPRKAPALAATSTEVSMVEVEEQLAPESDGAEIKHDEDRQTVDPDQAEGTLVAEAKESIVPSPATEDDPPTFFMTPHPSVEQVVMGLVKEQLDEAKEEQGGEDRAVRILRPTSTFDRFTLWTADAPLAGFRPDELAAKTGSTQVTPDADAAAEQSVSAAGQSGGEKADDSDRAGHSLQAGWWRVGGAGEGGDEFVRAMGEWLGLVEMVRPRSMR